MIERQSSVFIGLPTNCIVDTATRLYIAVPFGWQEAHLTGRMAPAVPSPDGPGVRDCGEEE